MKGKVVRLISDKNEQVGIVSIEDALERASAAGQDLVVVAPQAAPPVCRVMNFGKYQYEQSRKERLAKKKQVQQKLKEVKFHPNIDEHDYQTKLTHAIAFLEKGYKVKVSMFLRGREMAHSDLGIDLMTRFAEDTAKCGVAERPRKTGRMILLIISPGPSTKG